MPRNIGLGCYDAELRAPRVIVHTLGARIFAVQCIYSQFVGTKVCVAKVCGDAKFRVSLLCAHYNRKYGSNEKLGWQNEVMLHSCDSSAELRHGNRRTAPAAGRTAFRLSCPQRHAGACGWRICRMRCLQRIFLEICQTLERMIAVLAAYIND